MNDEQVQCIMAAILHAGANWEPDNNNVVLHACADNAVRLFRHTRKLARMDDRQLDIAAAEMAEKDHAF